MPSHNRPQASPFYLSVLKLIGVGWLARLALGAQMPTTDNTLASSFKPLDPPFSPDYYIHQGDEAASFLDYETAIQHYDAALVANPKNNQVLFKLIFCHSSRLNSKNISEEKELYHLKSLNTLVTTLEENPPTEANKQDLIYYYEALFRWRLSHFTRNRQLNLWKKQDYLRKTVEYARMFSNPPFNESSLNDKSLHNSLQALSEVFEYVISRISKEDKEKAEQVIPYLMKLVNISPAPAERVSVRSYAAAIESIEEILKIERGELHRFVLQCHNKSFYGIYSLERNLEKNPEDAGLLAKLVISCYQAEEMALTEMYGERLLALKSSERTRLSDYKQALEYYHAAVNSPQAEEPGFFAALTDKLGLGLILSTLGTTIASIASIAWFIRPTKDKERKETDRKKTPLQQSLETIKSKWRNFINQYSEDSVCTIEQTSEGTYRLKIDLGHHKGLMLENVFLKLAQEEFTETLYNNLLSHLGASTLSKQEENDTFSLLIHINAKSLNQDGKTMATLTMDPAKNAIDNQITEKFKTRPEYQQKRKQNLIKEYIKNIETTLNKDLNNMIQNFDDILAKKNETQLNFINKNSSFKNFAEIFDELREILNQQEPLKDSTQIIDKLESILTQLSSSKNSRNLFSSTSQAQGTLQTFITEFKEIWMRADHLKHEIENSELGDLEADTKAGQTHKNQNNTPPAALSIKSKVKEFQKTTLNFQIFSTKLKAMMHELTALEKEPSLESSNSKINHRLKKEQSKETIKNKKTKDKESKDNAAKEPTKEQIKEKPTSLKTKTTQKTDQKTNLNGEPQKPPQKKHTTSPPVIDKNAIAFFVEANVNKPSPAIDWNIIASFVKANVNNNNNSPIAQGCQIALSLHNEQPQIRRRPHHEEVHYTSDLTLQLTAISQQLQSLINALKSLENINPNPEGTNTYHVAILGFAAEIFRLVQEYRYVYPYYGNQLSAHLRDKSGAWIYQDIYLFLTNPHATLPRRFNPAEISQISAALSVTLRTFSTHPQESKENKSPTTSHSLNPNAKEFVPGSPQLDPKAEAFVPSWVQKGP